MHTDKGEKEVCFVYQHQPMWTPREHMAYFNINGYSYPVRGGVLFCFCGGEAPHGAWAPDNVPSEFKHRGFAFVRKYWQ